MQTTLLTVEQLNAIRLRNLDNDDVHTLLAEVFALRALPEKIETLIENLHNGMLLAYSNGHQVGYQNGFVEGRIGED